MVKNKTGGSKTKGLARKLVNAPVSDRIRKSEDDDECYAIVSKMLGNGMCHVNILHNDDILKNIVCHIRGKFRGRNKKSNLVATGGIVLVGLRAWDTNIKDCDLICIYIQNQVSSLNINISLFNSVDSFNSNLDLHDVEFSNTVIENQIVNDNDNDNVASTQFINSIINSNDIDFDAI